MATASSGSPTSACANPKHERRYANRRRHWNAAIHESRTGKRLGAGRRPDRVYSLGVTLYELLTQTPSTPGDDRQTLIRQIINEEPVALVRSIRPCRSIWRRSCSARWPVARRPIRIGPSAGRRLGTVPRRQAHARAATIARRSLGKVGPPPSIAGHAGRRGARAFDHRLRGRHGDARPGNRPARRPHSPSRSTTQRSRKKISNERSDISARPARGRSVRRPPFRSAGRNSRRRIGATGSAARYAPLLPSICRRRRQRPGLRQETALAHFKSAVIAARLGAVNDAIKEYESSQHVFEELVRTEPTRVEPRAQLALAHNNLGLLYAARSETDRARQEYLKAIEIQKRLVQEHADDPVVAGQLAESEANLGMLLDQSGDTKGAEQSLRSPSRCCVRSLIHRRASQSCRATWRSRVTT